jgi:hypothetical protein
MKASLLFLSAMELIKLHCLTSFLFLIDGQSLPLAPLTLAFIVAVVTDKVLTRKSRRVLFYFLIHLIAFAASFYSILLLTQGSPAGAAAFLPLEKTASVSFFILLGVVALYWLRGLWILKQGSGHEFTALRFDEGILLFLLSLFFSALLKLDNLMPGSLAIPFFVFGILALGSSNADENRRGGLSKRSRGAMVAATAGIFILSALGLALLIPLLLEPAKLAAMGLKDFSLSIVNIIAAILVWLFTRKGPPRPLEISETGGGAPRMAEEIAQQGMPDVMMWILIVVASLVALAILVLLLSLLIKFLSGKTKQSSAKPKGQSLFALLREFWKALRRLFGKLVRRLERRRGLSPALEAYRRLLAAGRAGGAPRAATETPREYALRLEASFEAAKNRALGIVAEVEKEVYGSGAQISRDEKSAPYHKPETPDQTKALPGPASLRQLAANLSPARFFTERLKKSLGFLNPKNRRNRATSRESEND